MTSTSQPETTFDESTGTSRETPLGLIGYKLRRAQLSVFQRFLVVFEELGLRPAEYSLLVLVENNPGQKQSDTAAALGIKRANFVPMVDGLEARGLIERIQLETDRRANGLHMTKAGLEFMARARALHDELESEFIARLGGPKQRDQLLSLLEKLT